MEITIEGLEFIVPLRVDRIWLEYYKKMPICPTFHLLKGDYRV